jgi:hypothetical protein
MLACRLACLLAAQVLAGGLAGGQLRVQRHARRRGRTPTTEHTYMLRALGPLCLTSFVADSRRLSHSLGDIRKRGGSCVTLRRIG